MHDQKITVRDLLTDTPTLKTDILFSSSLSNLARYLWQDGAVTAAVGRNGTSSSGPAVPFRASVLIWLAAAPCRVHQLNKAAPLWVGCGTYFMWYLNPGTIDWWPHEQLDFYQS